MTSPAGPAAPRPDGAAAPRPEDPPAPRPDDAARRRLLLVHAHPDDESIETGATMARYAAEGAEVTLVTCTLGELGEIIPPALAHLGPDGTLGEYRIGELAAACAALGVTRQRFLGGAGRWRDSGMIGTPDNDDPRCFWRADVAAAAAELATVLREVRPQVLVTYDANGFYGHPDHIQAHRVAWRAARLAADPSAAGVAGPPWTVRKFYATAMPRSVLAAAISGLRAEAASGRRPLPDGFVLPASAGDLPFGVPDGQVTTQIDASAHLGAKLAAMRAHATQIVVDGTVYALSNRVAQRVSGIEHYTLLAGPRGPATGPHGREDDLFAGIGAPAGPAGPGGRSPVDAAEAE